MIQWVRSVQVVHGTQSRSRLATDAAVPQPALYEVAWQADTTVQLSRHSCSLQAAARCLEWKVRAAAVSGAAEEFLSGK